MEDVMEVTHFYFSEKDAHVDGKVHITIPFKKKVINGKTYRVEIETKPHSTTAKQAIRVVINFRVVWKADDGTTIPITDFSPHGMDLKVGYGPNEPGPKLFWHSNPGKDRWTEFHHTKISTTVDARTVGFGVTTVMEWLDDPNVGWGA